jgi:hypothetical protein
MIRILLWGVDTMQIKPSESIRQNYYEISALCKSAGEPVYLRKNGEDDLVVMDIDVFNRCKKKLSYGKNCWLLRKAVWPVKRVIK